MKDFVFNNTTKVYFGKDQLQHLSEEIAQFGKKVGSSALMVGSLKEKETNVGSEHQSIPAM